MKFMKNNKKREMVAWLFLLPSLSGTTVFVLIPFADVIKRSFFDAMSRKAVGLNNYKDVLQNEAFQLASGNTLRFILTCIPVLLVLSLVFSVLIVGQKKHKNLFKVTYLLPMAIPVASVVLIWKVMFDDNGLLNELFLHFSLKPISFMNTSSAFYVLIFTYLWKNTGYDMVLWLAGLNDIPTSLYEAASIDGCNAWEKFKYITLPSLKPTLYVVAILSFINSFKVFREVYLVAGDYPHKSIYMLQHLFNNWFINLDIQKMSAAAVLIALMFFMGAFVLPWLLKKVYNYLKEMIGAKHENK